MNEETAITAALVLISPAGIIALVTLAKKFGVTGRWAMLAALGLGIALALGAWASGLAYAGAPAFAVGCAGALTGLAASGIYDATDAEHTYYH